MTDDDARVGVAQALPECGHVFHVRCISKWYDLKSREARERRARRGDDAEPTAPCPTCKKDFSYGECVVVYLDAPGEDEADGLGMRARALGGVGASSSTRRKSNGGTPGGGGGDAERAETERRARADREPLGEALDEIATLKRELREARAHASANEEVERKLRQKENALTALELSARTLKAKVDRGDDETRKLREKNADLAKKVAMFEDRERLEREVAANSSSLGEKEMMRRLERSDPRMAMTTLVRNLCAKNTQISSQQEQYDELVRRMREKEREVKSLETKVEAYRATSGSVAGTSDARREKEKTETNKAPTAGAFPIGGRASSKFAWGVDDPSEFEHQSAARAAPVRKNSREKRNPLRRGDDPLMKKLAPPSTNKTKATEKQVMSLLSDEDDGDDGLLANILNDVDERAARKRRRPAGSFLKASPNKERAPNANGTFIKHGADGRGGRGKFFAV